MTKPAAPTDPFADWPRITIDETRGGPFAQILRAAIFAADSWTFSPQGPYQSPGMTAAEVSGQQLREALLHLLELGLIDIDTERLNAAGGIPVSRRTPTA